ncbi:MAG: bis(5'-nucleosyl)-tetraphosphatase (symmetrical) YqeK [Vampirovibrionales bacterium]|nr:bis(5'-nucleosyl)-tetraphosphatase (symmetrical) YqeK [Vampirovibrionales bacterium]
MTDTRSALDAAASEAPTFSDVNALAEFLVLDTDPQDARLTEAEAEAFLRLFLTLDQALRETISQKRYLHSFGVAEAAITLARHYGWPAPKLRQVAIAALMHDFARETDFETLLQEAARLNVPLSALDYKIPLVLHARVGPAWLKSRFDITDPEILAAVAAHTTCGHGMAPDIAPTSLLIYVADKIEHRTRDTAWHAPAWRIACAGEPDALARAALWCLDESVKHLIRRGVLIHPESVMARNKLLLLLRTPNTGDPNR